MLTREQIESAPAPYIEAGNCGVSPVFAWAGSLVGAQWSEQDIEAVCGCTDPGTRYDQVLKVVNWVLNQGLAVTEVIRLPRLRENIEEEHAVAEYEQITELVRSHPGYAYQESPNCRAMLRQYVRNSPLVAVVADGEKARMVGVAGSIQGGRITALYNPSKPNLAWRSLDKTIARVAKEVPRSNWPTFVLHSQ